MIVLNLWRLLAELSKKYGCQYGLPRLGKESGIHRATLWRLANGKPLNTSTEHIDLLVQFFCRELQDTEPGLSKEKLLTKILTELITVECDIKKFPVTEQMRRSRRSKLGIKR